MSTALRWLGHALGGIALLAALAVAAVYARSEQVIRTTYPVALEAFTASSDAASVAEGERLARILGCAGGCHGKQLVEGRMFGASDFGRVFAPDLTRAAARMSDAELERVIRHGVRQDGTSVWEMPVLMFQHLSDTDLAQVIAFLRAQPLSDGPTQTIEPALRWRWEMATGLYTPFAPELLGATAHMARPDGTDPKALGRYLALTVCTECHQQDLHGQQGDAADLVVVAAYPFAEFATLLRTGVPLDGRDLELMDEVALSRFSHFTDAEIAALHAYLSTDLAAGR